MYLRRICALQLLLQLLQLPIVRCYKNHSALSAVIFTNIEPPDDNVHSEYYFGNCALSTKKNLIHRRIWTYEQLKGQMIIRAGLPRDPVFLPTDTCVYIRTKSTYADLVRYHAYKFNICICKLNYNYGGEIFDYFYYEWYIPVEMYKNIDWEIFIYIT